jgi:hypothetical protein
MSHVEFEPMIPVLERLRRMLCTALPLSSAGDRIVRWTVEETEQKKEDRNKKITKEKRKKGEKKE